MAQLQLPLPDPTPAIPPKVRSVAYFVALGWGGLTTTIAGVAAAVAPSSAVVVLAVLGAVSNGVAFVVGGLGVAFRPTAGKV